MKILSSRDLGIPGVRVISFARFPDGRGYFTETYRDSEIGEALGAPGFRAVQLNESFSRGGVLRGLHAQWDPHQGKLVRPVSGRLLDLALDVRKGSPTFGKIVAHAIAAEPGAESSEWIWIPPGFAHGTYFPEDTVIEYLCTAAWSPGCELSISPHSPAIDWSLSAEGPAEEVRAALAVGALLSEKDRHGTDLAAWSEDPRSEHFVYEPGRPWDVADRA